MVALCVHSRRGEAARGKVLAQEVPGHLEAEENEVGRIGGAGAV